MDGRPTWTDCDEAGDYVVSYVYSPRDLVSRPDKMDETVPHTTSIILIMALLRNFKTNIQRICSCFNSKNVSYALQN